VRQSAFCERLFHALDVDCAGAVEGRELLVVLSALCRSGALHPPPSALCPPLPSYHAYIRGCAHLASSRVPRGRCHSGLTERIRLVFDAYDSDGHGLLQVTRFDLTFDLI
jgi:hypothetical protein